MKIINGRAVMGPELKIGDMVEVRLINPPPSEPPHRLMSLSCSNAGELWFLKILRISVFGMTLGGWRSLEVWVPGSLINSAFICPYIPQGGVE